MKIKTIKKKTKTKITPLVITKQDGKEVFFCLVEDEKNPHIALCRKVEKGFEIIRQMNIFDESEKEENLKGCYNFHVFKSGTEWYLLYSREYSSLFKKKKQTVIAKSSDMTDFDIIDREQNRTFDSLAKISNYKHNDSFIAYFGTSYVRVAASADLKNWHFSGKLFGPRKDNFDKDNLHVFDVLKTKRGLFVMYESKPKSVTRRKKLLVGGAIFSAKQPYKMIWRCQEPVLEKKLGKGNYVTKYLGSFVEGDTIETFWLSKNGSVVSANINTNTAGVGSIKKRALHLDRHHKNPIIQPKAEHSWEYDATFNPAAINLGDKVHLIYRAIGENGVSVFGYASSKDGFEVAERLKKPAFAAMNFENYCKEDKALYPSKYVSGGSWIGCEDPRITKIEDRVYMTYTSFDGCNPPGVSLTWIDAADFLKKKWTWKRPILISKPGQIQKNWMLFPEKVNGKYAILHSITPQISIEYVDDLEKEGIQIESQKKPGKDEHRWDNVVRGAGAPPIMTEHGWLILYHAMDRKDPDRYKVGAMILDAENPEKILYRSDCPILEPDESYENSGAKAGVVYVCGAVVKGDTLFVYYGGADSVVCVATADIKNFLDDIVKNGAQCTKLKKPRKARAKTTKRKKTRKTKKVSNRRSKNKK